MRSWDLLSLRARLCVFVDGSFTPYLEDLK
jgi:hypothetical protein